MKPDWSQKATGPYDGLDTADVLVCDYGPAGNVMGFTFRQGYVPPNGG